MHLRAAFFFFFYFLVRAFRQGGWRYSKAENLTRPEHFAPRPQPGVGGGFDLLVTAKDAAWFNAHAAGDEGASSPAAASCAAAAPSGPVAWVEVHVARGFTGLRAVPLGAWLRGVIRGAPSGYADGLGWLPIRVATEPQIRVLATAALAARIQAATEAETSESWRAPSKISTT